MLAQADESIAKKDANIQRTPHVGSPFPESFVQIGASSESFFGKQSSLMLTTKYTRRRPQDGLRATSRATSPLHAQFKRPGNAMTRHAGAQLASGNRVVFGLSRGGRETHARTRRRKQDQRLCRGRPCLYPVHWNCDRISGFVRAGVSAHSTRCEGALTRMRLQGRPIIVTQYGHARLF